MKYFQIGLSLVLGYAFCEYYIGAGEVVCIFAAGIGGIAYAYQMENLYQ